MKYKWTRNAMGKLEAQVVGEELETIQKKRGVLTPEVVVKEASKKTSKIHGCFEWDDSAAAKEHRLNQARYMLRSIEVVVETTSSVSGGDASKDIEIRAFHNVETAANEKVYVTLTQAKENDNYWNQVKEKALSEIKSWQAKYSSIEEFEVIFSAIEQVA